MSTIGSKASNGAEAVRDAAQQAGEHIDEATRGARKAAADTWQDAAAYGRQHGREAYDAAQGMARSAGRYARENPMQAILIGLGGLLLANLLFRRR
jgi:ElaB/YqjD/DUF883 family membrane-anchored ribosome-binding protein